MEHLLTPTEVAGILRVKIHTLAAWRATGRGPRYLRLGASRNAPIRYRREDVAAWAESHRPHEEPEAQQ